MDRLAELREFKSARCKCLARADVVASLRLLPAYPSCFAQIIGAKSEAIPVLAGKKQVMGGSRDDLVDFSEHRGADEHLVRGRQPTFGDLAHSLLGFCRKHSQAVAAVISAKTISQLPAAAYPSFPLTHSLV